ncbi:Reversal of tor2 lethality [Ascosphaera pollenicola]|nr:Reversal of tor2 lethality [Ascosphaera pollenicola]
MLKLFPLKDGLASLLGVLALILSIFASICAADEQKIDSDLVGTWVSKSGKVKTGSDFYDPEKDNFTEPSLPGISYSFSKDGHYEEALYRAIANPSEPDCVKAIIQWQHGSWYVAENDSLILNPIKVDGRQQVSDPCTDDEHSVYSRYNQTELFMKYEVTTDSYHNKKRLDLYAYDGTPVNPMLLDSDDPSMLPTTTLNPTTTTATAHSRIKRRNVFAGAKPRTRVSKQGMTAADRSWWLGVIMTSAGGLMLLIS